MTCLTRTRKRLLHEENDSDICTVFHFAKKPGAPRSLPHHTTSLNRKKFSLHTSGNLLDYYDLPVYVCVSLFWHISPWSLNTWTFRNNFSFFFKKIFGLGSGLIYFVFMGTVCRSAYFNQPVAKAWLWRSIAIKDAEMSSISHCPVGTHKKITHTFTLSSLISIHLPPTH